MPICTYIFSQFLSTVLPFSFIQLSFLLFYFRCYILTEEKVYVWCYINWRKLLLLPIHNFIKRAFHLERKLIVIRKQMSLLWRTVSKWVFDTFLCAPKAAQSPAATECRKPVRTSLTSFPFGVQRKPYTSERRRREFIKKYPLIHTYPYVPFLKN